MTIKTKVAVLAVVGALSISMTPAQAQEPAPEQYDLNVPHTQIIFSVEHMGFSHSYGKFLDYTGHFTFDKAHPEQSSVEATIKTASLDLADKKWNEHTLEFFHPDKFPTMTFKSTSIKVTGDKTADITGDFTLLGVTKPVVLHTVFNKADKTPFGQYVAGFSATADITRSDFGMKDGLPFVSDNVHLIIEVEGNRPVEEHLNK